MLKLPAQALPARLFWCPMTPRTLGRTTLSTSAFGFGAGPLGDAALTENEAERLVHRALELGVTLFDTAPSYGNSEQRLGRALSGRRHEVTLVTKGGYGVQGVGDWTEEVITRGIDQALERLATDHLDVFLLHSCGPELLERLLVPLEAAKRAGKTRAFGYSGDGAGLERAVELGRYEIIETSVNLVDQASLRQSIPRATAAGLGVMAKRALANAVWEPRERPSRPDIATYFDRFHALALQTGMPWDELALRFATFAPGVDVALAGTRRLEHLERLTACVSKGPLSAELQHAVISRFAAVGGAWPGVI
jgi:aryl-alcohol dehydrogenase-like predicted oxidoreductase